VLRRDGWQCQFCGSRAHLEVHHQRFRSHSGQDYEDNLITLVRSTTALLSGLKKSITRSVTCSYLNPKSKWTDVPSLRSIRKKQVAFATFTGASFVLML